jgi:hypothetical protein
MPSNHNHLQVYEQVNHDVTVSFIDCPTSANSDNVFELADDTVAVYPVSAQPEAGLYQGRPECATVLFALLDKSVDDPPLFLRILTTLHQASHAKFNLRPIFLCFHSSNVV